MEWNLFNRGILEEPSRGLKEKDLSGPISTGLGLSQYDSFSDHVKNGGQSLEKLIKWIWLQIIPSLLCKSCPHLLHIYCIMFSTNLSEILLTKYLPKIWESCATPWLKLCIKLKGLGTWPLAKGQEHRALVWPGFLHLQAKVLTWRQPGIRLMPGWDQM